jgi:hypothetical protein
MHAVVNRQAGSARSGFSEASSSRASNRGDPFKSLARFEKGSKGHERSGNAFLVAESVKTQKAQTGLSGTPNFLAECSPTYKN